MKNHFNEITSLIQYSLQTTQVFLPFKWRVAGDPVWDERPAEGAASPEEVLRRNQQAAVHRQDGDHWDDQRGRRDGSLHVQAVPAES